MNLNHWMNLNKFYKNKSKEKLSPKRQKCRKRTVPNRTKESLDMKKKSYKKLDRILEMPKEVCSDIPKIIITGFDEMIIENFKGILEYEEFFVRINTHIGIININGFNLNLENMTNDDIKVTGKIESMDVERTVD